MDNTAGFEGEVLVLLHQLNAKKERIQAQYAEALASVDREIEAVSTTARLLREPKGEGAHVAIVQSGVVIPGDLRGKSIRHACVEIARANGGLLRITDAKWPLVDARVVTSKKHAWGAIYTTLIRSKEFEKVPNQPGTFRLVDQTSRQGQLVA